MNLNNIFKNIVNSNVYNIIKKTPLKYAYNLSNKTNNHIWLKREDILPIHSFKLRGAYNKISKLNNYEKKNGIIACSAGNHAQGVAYSAKILNLKSTIVMPKITPKIKLDAVKSFGAEVIIDGNNFDESKKIALQIMKNKRKTFIDPYDDIDVISGQGTIGLELIEQIKNKNIDNIFCCVGGGGLISGIGSVIKVLDPNIKIIGVEASKCCAMTKSLKKNKIIELNEICTYAEGAAVKKVGKLNFKICKEVIDEMITVNNNQINDSIIDAFMDTRTILEPAGALALAGVKKYIKKYNLKNSNNVVITSGANIDFKKLRYISEKIENDEAFLSIQIPEKIGSFKKLYDLIYPRNVTEFSYRYNNSQYANIYISFQTNNISKIIEKIENKKYNVINLKENILAKDHIRYLIGGKKIIDERIFRFNFPEKPGALNKFINNLTTDFNVTLFHYRNHGCDIGKVLVGIQTTNNTKLNIFLNKLGYKYYEETNNIVIKTFL